MQNVEKSVRALFESEGAEAAKKFFAIAGAVGLAAGGVYVSAKGGKSVLSYTKSFFNKSKYLDSENSRCWAVIFGACNKAGEAFASYLFQSGFNLVLIDRQQSKLDALRIKLLSLGRKETAHGAKLEFVEITSFETDSLARKLKKTKSLPVKLFINTKNSRRKTKEMTADDLESVSTFTDMAPFGKEEIYFLGKENIEGYSSVLHYYLPALHQVQNSALLNIDTKLDPSQQKNVKRNMYFLAAQTFQDSLTTQLGRNDKHLGAAINVKIDF